MKKLLAILLVLIMAFTVVSCDETTEPSEFDPFILAVNQTPSSKIKISSELETSLGVLHSTVETTLNPDGGAKLVYSVENFNTDFTSTDLISTTEGVVTVDKDGNYSDGGAFKGKINEELTALEFNFDSSKFESYQVSGNILTGTVMQDETEAVFGVFIDADVSFMLTIGNNRVQSLALNYELYSGTMKVVCTYN